MKSVAVIGAGGAGLAMARYLCVYPNLFELAIYEQNDEIGGTWIYDASVENIYNDKGRRNGNKELIEMVSNDDLHSSMYKSLRTNLPKQVMQFPDFPFPKDTRTFSGHQDVLKYLRDYCEHFDLRRFIKFKTKVTHVTPSFGGNYDSNMSWKVTVVDKDYVESSLTFDAVVVCNGHFSKPKVPEIPNIDKFHGLITHSHFYRVPEPFKNMNVIVLGARSSGRDIAIEISKVANRVMLSHRGKKGILQLPSNMIETQAIKELDEFGGVVFEDGEIVEADAIIYCTGYLYDLPFLDQNCGISVKNGRVFPLYKQIFNALYPSMAFIGLACVVCPFQLFSLQAKWIANFLSGKVNLPTSDEMLQDYHNELEQRKQAGSEERHFHRFANGMQWHYYNTISDLGKVETIKGVVKKMYQKASSERETNLLYYRETEYNVIDDDSFEVI